ncbi:hypothetical protein CRG98_040849 [Punica granatum]|nr:hypothetical protein CRG98_040849 [Punica granatum]
MALAVDPLFFYVLSIAGRGPGEGNGNGGWGAPCLYMDGWLAAIVTVVRTCLDTVHVMHMWLQFRLAYVSRESLVIGCGKLVWDPRAIASRYARSFKGLWFDLLVILPIPQVVVWLVIPKLVREEKQVKLIMPLLLVIILLQFLPKVYHSICLMRRMRKVTGYIFGSIWWGFGLNLIAYFIASHVAGGCWYVLAVQRVMSCLQKQCAVNPKCNSTLSCLEPVCYMLRLPGTGPKGRCGGEQPMSKIPRCLDENGPYKFGIYSEALPVISSNSLSVRILYPIFWGLLNLSTFANELAPTSELLEVIFSITIVLSGLMLFTLLVGNIQVFLHAVMVKKKKMQLRFRDIEWWMRRRQLPSHLRQRVYHFEHQRWAALGGEDEMELIKDLPDGLRRDIKRYLCLDLIKKVPLFHDLDDLILDNICDRVQPLLYSKDEKIIREGDPVHKMVFIMQGLVRRDQNLSKGSMASNLLEPGGFLGDELLSWSLRRGSSTDRLPASAATFVCLRTTEAFGLDAGDLRYITDHFRYRFADDKLKRTTRYFSSNWRTWAAVNIQFAWRRHRMRIQGHANLATHTPADINGGSEKMLRRYAIMFMSLRPHDHLE